jgi:hypothetical protein
MKMIVITRFLFVCVFLLGAVEAEEELEGLWIPSKCSFSLREDALGWSFWADEAGQSELLFTIQKFATWATDYYIIDAHGTLQAMTRSSGSTHIALDGEGNGLGAFKPHNAQDLALDVVLPNHTCFHLKHLNLFDYSYTLVDPVTGASLVLVETGFFDKSHWTIQVLDPPYLWANQVDLRLILLAIVDRAWISF